MVCGGWCRALVSLGWLSGIAIVVCATMHAHADDPFLGRWSIDPAGLSVRHTVNTAATTPFIVTDHSVTWYMSSCTIKKSYRIGEGFICRRNARREGRSRVMPDRLSI